MPALSIRAVSLTTVLLTACGALCSESASLRETPLVKAVRECRESVVNIHTEKRQSDKRDSRFFSQKERRVTGMGTGIVVDERGYIVTNYHVIQDVEQIIVTLADGETLSAQSVSFDREHDLAILRIQTAKPLAVMPIGTSSDLMLAEQVFAVGNAFGYEHTITSGIISAISRDVEVDETQSYKNLIQTDTSINPGNSGGPLLNLEGRVIGINVAIRAGAQRIGFAIPIDDARDTIARLLSTERLNHVAHGLIGRDVNTSSAQHLVVHDVINGSPADHCGIQAGDVVLQVRNVAISDSADWERSLLDMPVGSTLDVEVERNGNRIPLTLKVGIGSPVKTSVSARQVSSAESRPRSPHDDRTPAVLKDWKPALSGIQITWQMFGLRLTELSVRERRQLSPKYNGGMKVTSVRPGAAAARHGIRKGDILLGLDGYETLRERHLEFILDDARLRAMTSVSFRITRNGSGALDGSMTMNSLSENARANQHSAR